MRAPTLVMHARGDARVPFDEGRVIAAGIPNAQFLALESNNHVLMENEPAWPRFQAMVREFLGSGPALPATARPGTSPAARFGADAATRLGGSTTLRTGARATAERGGAPHVRPGSAFAELTARELEIVTQVALGSTNAQIAAHLSISEKTVRNHLTAIFAKLEVSSRAQAIVLAREQGLLGAGR